VRVAAEGRDVLAGALERFLEARGSLGAARAALAELLRLDPARAFGDETEAGHLDRMRDTAVACRRNAGELRAWCRYRAATGDAAALGLAELTAALESSRIPPEELGPVLERSLLDTWIGALLAAEPVLGKFSGTRHELDIRNFARLDREVMRLTTRVLRARLAARVPREGAEGTRSPSSEMGLLHRELGKRRRHLPVRQLFQRVPNVLPRIKPCMLMSPLSVAQYLAPETPPFDLVVFDEASQMPAWDAIGAIARGRRLVVVGDTKQLPPTTFFTREEAEEVFDEGEIEDLESILDECVAVRLPRRQLKWHYRSRHEELIAFSNYHYYGNRLFTFPSVVGESERMGVFLRPVPDGTYDKGRSRTNRREAEELVAEVVRRLEDPEESRRSIGIVTFSIAQQVLIEDLLDEARRHHPAIDPSFTSDVDEPVFVKNLENVQGDERDVIFFSVCYGPDATGRVSMNFGPLNKAGGERRLNVAITRAREQVVVFSTLRADQIDLARTRAVGVRHLRTFLEYARSGAAAIAESSSVPPDAAAAPFETSVRRSLEARGWTVDAQVGCSGYRIDLAVRHPEDHRRYLCGIECDGAMYASARTARDRDRLRSAVLRSLGWRLHRVWSTDWYYEPERELERLEAALRDALRGAAPPPSVAEPIPDAPAEPTDTSVAPCRPYTPLEAAAPVGTPEDLHDPAQAARLRDVLAKALKREAPIALDLLARRVAAAFDVGRVTARVVDRVRELLPEASGVLREPVVWLVDQDPQDFHVYRVPPEGAEANRQAEEIPVEEIANAAEHLLSAHVSIRREDLARETARLFGFGRLGSRVQRAMEAGIDALAARNGCALEGEMVIATHRERPR
jgi:very-short-patch-repair endonuclease